MATPTDARAEDTIPPPRLPEAVPSPRPMPALADASVSASLDTLLPASSRPESAALLAPSDSLDTLAPPLAPSTALANRSALAAPQESSDTLVRSPGDPPPQQPHATHRTKTPAGPPSFELMKELGRGAMGVVYKARQIGLNRLVALKMVLSGGMASPEELDRFRNEAAAIARLSHPAIVQVYEIGDHGGMPYFAMEYCPGGSLASHTAGHPLNPQRAARLLALLAEGMHHAHQAGIIHRDLKPANVLAMRLDDAGRPIDGPSDLTEIIRGSKGDLSRVALKIADFGLARLESSAHTRSGDLLGTPSYMSPEQAAGRLSEVSPATDVWALGAILYDLLSGRPPFRGSTVMETVSLVLDKEPVPLRQLRPDVPRDLETICHKCLQKDRSKRYATARELADDLERFANGQPILARPVGPIERTTRWARRHPFQAISLAACVALLFAVMAGLYGLYLVASLEGQAHRRELAEQNRLNERRSSFASLYASAQKAAADGSWAEVERDASTALGLLGEPELADHPLAEAVASLRDRARGELADARLRAEARERFDQFRAHHGDAVVFSSDFTGVEVSDGLQRTHRAVAAGLALFGVTVEEAPSIDQRFFSPAEAALISGRCHELLLLEADALARPVAGEPVEALRARLRQALARIDRADRLAGAPTRAGLHRRARFLAALGDSDADAVRLKAEQTPARLAADHFLAGLDHYRREDYAAAAEPLSIVLRQQPDHYGAEFLLALCRLQQRQFQAGREGLSRCLQMRPTFAWPRLLRGYAAIELQEWDEARADFDAVLATPPDETAAYVARVNRSVLWLRRRDWPAAIEDLNAAIALRPGAAAAHVNLALVHRQRAEVQPWQHGLMRLGPQGAFAVVAVDAHQRQAYQEAVTVLDRGVEQCPKDARLYHERARLCLLLDRRQQAREDFTKAVELAVTRGSAGTLADDLVELGRLLYREKRHEEAVRAYQAALAIRSDRATAWRLMAQPLLALKRYQEAGEALDRFIATVPVAPGKAPTPEQARTLAEALKVRGLIHDEYARTFRDRAALHLRHNELRAALDCYTQGLKFVRDPEVLALRGWTYVTHDSAELAQADFDEAVRLRPGFGDALIGRATARVKLGKVAEALKDVEKGVEASPSAARPPYNAARVHALAVAALRDAPKQKADAERSEKRAAELLRLALERTPPGERPAFWKQYVQADRAFDPIRRGSALAALAARYDSPTR